MSSTVAKEAPPSTTPAPAATLWEDDPPGYIQEGIEAMKLALASDAAEYKAEQVAVKAQQVEEGCKEICHAGAIHGVEVRDFAVFKEVKGKAGDGKGSGGGLKRLKGKLL